MWEAPIKPTSSEKEKKAKIWFEEGKNRVTL